MSHCTIFSQIRTTWSILMSLNLEERQGLVGIEGKLRGAAAIDIVGAPNVKIIDLRCATVQVVHRMALGLPHRPIEEAFEGMALVEQVSRKGCITAYLHPVTTEGGLPSRTLAEFLGSQGILLEQR